MSNKLCLIAIAVGMLYQVFTMNELAGRDKELVQAVNQITEVIATERVVGSTVYPDYFASLVGYLARYHKVNIDTTRTNLENYKYIITLKNQPDHLPPTFEKSALKTEVLDLYQRR